MVKIRGCVAVTLNATCVCCYKVSPQGKSTPWKESPVLLQRSVDQFTQGIKESRVLLVSKCSTLWMQSHILLIHKICSATAGISTFILLFDFQHLFFYYIVALSIIWSVTWIRKEIICAQLVLCPLCLFAQLWVQTTIHVCYVIFHPSSPKDYTMLCSASLQ